MTNLNRNFYALLAILALLAASACNDPTDLGSDLISGDFSDIQYTDTVSIRAVTTTQDSVQTYTPTVSAQARSYLCGRLADPIFGTSEASMYFDLRLLATSTILGRADVFQNGTLDSLVLAFAYDTLRVYGDTLDPQSFNVYRVIEEIDSGEDHYSDEDFATEATPIGTVSGLLARPRMESEVIEGDDTTTYSPQLRIRLDDALALELMNYDSLVYASSEDFKATFQGIKVQPDPSNTNMLSFNLSSASTHMRLYYTVDTSHYFFTYDITDLSVKHSSFAHDHSVGSAAPFADDATLGDSLVFTQGMSGYNVKIDFPYIRAFEEQIAVNKAELEFTYAYLPGDDTTNLYAPLQLALTYQDPDDGKYYFISDLNEALLVGALGDFGGAPIEEDENGMLVKRYRVNISNYLQDIIDNNLGNVGNSMHLQVYLKNQNPPRAVLYGPGHSQYPMKLLLTYTRL